MIDPAVQELLDLEQIKRLKARYFRCLDRKDWDAWAEVFAEDAVMEVPEADMAVSGRAEIVSGVRSVIENAKTCHHGHMPEIEITGPETATGIWAMFDRVEWPPAEDGSLKGLTGFGHYSDDYRKVDGTWRISRLRLDRLWIDSLR